MYTTTVELEFVCTIFAHYASKYRSETKSLESRKIFRHFCLERVVILRLLSWLLIAPLNDYWSIELGSLASFMFFYTLFIL